VECKCPSSYIGSLCQYNIQEANISELINDYKLIGSQTSIADLYSILKAKELSDSDKDLICQLYDYICKIFF
jgi:hypothetical protein